MDEELPYGLLDRLLGSRSKHEIPCPICSAARKAHNRQLACFGLYRKSSDEIVFNCMHCGIKGKRTDGWRGQDKVEPHPIETQKPEDLGAYAAQLWAESIDPRGTDTERYWVYRELVLPIPPTIRHLPGMMIAAAGLPILAGDEWHAPEGVRAVQRTFLKPGGQGKTGKKSVGPLKGKPICVHVNPESLGLVIGEGIEKVHAFAQARGLDGWATAGIGFFPHLALAVPRWVEVVTIIHDPQADIAELGRELVDRGIEVKIARAWRPHA